MKVRGLTSFFLALLVLLVALPAWAATTSWICGSAGCKYDQARAQYTGGFGLYTVQEHHIWGSTASGVCDPSNDGIQWRWDASELWVNGVKVFSNGPSIWRTNCNIDNAPPPPGYWIINVNRSYDSAGSAYSRHVIKHDHACGGCDFSDVIINNLPVG